MYVAYYIPVPQQGDLDITTEMGCLKVARNHICIIPVSSHNSQVSCLKINIVY